MNAYVELARPGNAVMAGLASLLGMLVVLGPDLWDADLAVPVALGVSVPFLVTAGGNALNDYMDQEVDRQAHPGRPLPSGRVQAESVLRFSMGCFVAGIVLAALIVTLGDAELLPVFIAALAITCLVGYETVLKYRGLSGNVMVAILSPLTFVFGASVVADPGHEAWTTVVVLFALAHFASLGREVTKDIEDMEADRGSRSTLPMTYGVRAAFVAVTVYILAAVTFSIFPYHPLDTMGWPYLPLVAAADVVFIYSLPFVRSSPGDAQRIQKVGMMIALLAFLAGSLTGGIS